MSYCCTAIRRYIVVGVAAWGLVSASQSLASVDHWASAVSGVWQNGANWLDGSTPGGSDTAFFNLAGAYTVSFNGTPVPIQALSVSDGTNATFTSANILNVGTLQVTSASDSEVLVTHDATLTLGTSGGIFNPDRPLHLTAGNNLLPEDPALTVQNNATLNVYFGSDVVANGSVDILSGGELDVSSGGRVESFVGSIDDGYVSIVGTNSQWIISGYLAVDNGTLSITSGGSVSSHSDFISSEVGIGPDSTGLVNVSGAGSTWANDATLIVGSLGGTGALWLTYGGSVTVANGTGLVRLAEGSGSQGLLQIGMETPPGTIQAAEVRGEMGAASVLFNHTDTSYSFTPQLTGSVNVIHEGPGTTHLTAATTYTGGTLVTAGKLNVQQGLAGGGSVFVNGGHLDVMGGMTANGATISLESGVVSADSISLATGGAFDFLGGTLHVDTFTGNLVNQGGTLAPGRSAGNSTILGNYTQQAGAILEIEIGGTSAGGSHDLVGITGTVVLGGELQLSLINGFVPAAGETFTVLSTSVPFGVVGGFSNVSTGERLATLDGLGSFLVNYGTGSPFNQNQIILTAFGLTGDYNDDGAVDAADYVVWRKNLGTTNPLPNETASFGIVDQADYMAWRGNFGATSGSGSALGKPSQANVPEPAGVVLWLLASAGVWSLARNRLPRHSVAIRRDVPVMRPEFLCHLGRAKISCAGVDPMTRLCAGFGRSVLLLVAATCSYFSSDHAHAVTSSWNTNSSGLFTAAANWDNGEPVLGDTAVFNRGAGVAYTVTFPGGSILDPPPIYVIDYLRVHSNDVTFRDNSSQFISSPGFAVANPDVSVVIGQDAGEVAILNTSLYSFSGANTSIGRAAGANGTLNVTAGTFHMSEDIEVGFSGTGELNVTGIGSVTGHNTSIGRAAGANGTLNVSAGTFSMSNELEIGGSGKGTLNVAGVGNVASANVNVGRFNGSNGTLNIDGGTLGVSGAFNVGRDGTGVLNIRNRGTVTVNGITTIGQSSGTFGCVATVSGVDSVWSNIGAINVLGTHAALTIQDGGRVVSNSVVTIFGSGKGTVTITGVSSSLTSSALQIVGNNGAATLTIQDGATLATGSALIAASFSTDDTVTVDGTGSSWENSGDVLFGGSACVSCFGSPTLNIQNHGTVSVGGQLLLGEIGAIRSDGTGNLAGNVKYAGTISPGNLPGRLRIDGNLTNNVGNFQNGKLQFALASTTSFAKLEVTGDVSLGGMLEVIRLGGHNPTAGESYDILDWGGSLTGTFSNIQLPTLAAGRSWDTSQLYITGVISVVGPQLPGDYNQNGIVDAADYVLWRNGGPFQNEVDTPGVVNVADYTAWRTRFGNSGSGAGANVNAVPEPATTVLLIILAASGMFSRQCRSMQRVPRSHSRVRQISSPRFLERLSPVL